MFPVTRSPRVAACYARIARLDRARTDLCNDPMSEYAPVEDFMEDYDSKERKALSDLIAAAVADGDSEARAWAFDRLERWMP